MAVTLFPISRVSDALLLIGHSFFAYCCHWITGFFLFAELIVFLFGLLVIKLIYSRKLLKFVCAGEVGE